MINMKPLIFSAFLLLSISAFSQSSELLNQLPTTKAEFVASEKQVINTIDWLENTPVDQNVEKRDAQKALLVAWITNSPTVTLNVNADILTFTKKNPELIIYFMGGWTRYSLQNNYSTDVILGSTAGIRSVIDVYKKGWFKKDKEMEKIIEMDQKGELDSWIKTKLANK